MDSSRYELYRQIANLAEKAIYEEIDNYFKSDDFRVYVKNMCRSVALKYVDLSIAQVQAALSVKEKCLLIDYYIKPENRENVMLQICHAVDRQTRGCS